MNHDVLRHLGICPSCRADVDGRRRLRGALRLAVNRTPGLQAQPDFSARLRDRLRAEARSQPTRALSRRSWLALAAGLVLAIGLTGRLVVGRLDGAADALAQDAIGDHRNCALKFRSVRLGVPLSEAAPKFDSAYRLLINAPPDDISTPGGPVRVVERHACAYDSRRFGHLVMRYRGHVVSLLMTTGSGGRSSAEAMPHLIGGSTNGLSVVAVNGLDHTILLVSDLEGAELTQLSTIIARPLAQRLAAMPPQNAQLMVALRCVLPTGLHNRLLAVTQ